MENGLDSGFSSCCLSSIYRASEIAGCEVICEKCGKQCEITDLKARILVGEKKGEVLEVTRIIHQPGETNSIVYVLVPSTDEYDSFEISYHEPDFKLISTKMMLDEAIKFATKKHFGQKRIGGLDYITHPIAVGRILESMGFDVETVIAGFYHDLAEDTDATDEEMIRYGSKKILATVKLVTKTKGYIMKDYVFLICQDERAKMVKLADRLHNLLSAVVASEKFRIRYIKETEDYYLDMAKGTPFEDKINVALEQLKATVA